VKVGDAPKTEGKYAMMLQDYLNRRAHVSKGDWKRPADPKYNKGKGDDYGRTGCKDGVGMFHPMLDGRCIYCNLRPSEIKKKQAQADKEKA
jgi:hypothetical protein